jgi:hypothetical protein
MDKELAALERRNSGTDGDSVRREYYLDHKFNLVDKEEHGPHSLPAYMKGLKTFGKDEEGKPVPAKEWLKKRIRATYRTFGTTDEHKVDETKWTGKSAGGGGGPAGAPCKVEWIDTMTFPCNLHKAKYYQQFKVIAYPNGCDGKTIENTAELNATCNRTGKDSCDNTVDAGPTVTVVDPEAPK